MKMIILLSAPMFFFVVAGICMKLHAYESAVVMFGYGLVAIAAFLKWA